MRTTLLRSDQCSHGKPSGNPPCRACVEASARLRGVAVTGRIRCGDEVYNHYTGETWVVAYAEYESGRLAWFGWPEGSTALSGCELTRICSDEEHARAVAQWLDVPHANDHRPSVIRRLYREVRS